VVDNADESHEADVEPDAADAEELCDEAADVPPRSDDAADDDGIDDMELMRDSSGLRPGESYPL
jgi:hypothetical protein